MKEVSVENKYQTELCRGKYCGSDKQGLVSQEAVRTTLLAQLKHCFVLRYQKRRLHSLLKVLLKYIECIY